MKLRGWRLALVLTWSALGFVTMVTTAGLAWAASFGAAPAWEYAPPSVAVQSGVDLDHDQVTREVQEIASDPRGWRQDLDHVTVVFVDPGRHGTEAMPGTIGRSFGESGFVVITVQAWTELGQRFAEAGGTIQDQRVWILQHELGHQIGLTHAECAGNGPAPIMRSSSFGLAGCDLSIWPNP